MKAKGGSRRQAAALQGAFGTAIFMEAKDLSRCLRFKDLRTTAEMLRCAQHDRILIDFGILFVQYMAMAHIESRILDRELKKGSAELLILSLVESRPRHGYDISKLIEQRSRGTLRFHVASLYPLLYRLEKRGWIQGRWVEKAGQRRRRYYRLTQEGRRVLASQRHGWQVFVAAINRITQVERA